MLHMYLGLAELDLLPHRQEARVVAVAKQYPLRPGLRGPVRPLEPRDQHEVSRERLVHLEEPLVLAPQLFGFAGSVWFGCCVVVSQEEIGKGQGGGVEE